MKTKLSKNSRRKLKLDKRFGSSLTKEELEEKLNKIRAENQKDQYEIEQKKLKYIQHKTVPKAVLLANESKSILNLIPQISQDEKRIDIAFNSLIVSMLNCMEYTAEKIESNGNYKSGRTFQKYNYKYYCKSSKLRESGYTLAQLCKTLQAQLNLDCQIPQIVLKHFFLFNSDCLYSHILYVQQTVTSALKTSGYSNIANHKGKPNIRFIFDEDITKEFYEYREKAIVAIKKAGMDIKYDIYK